MLREISSWDDNLSIRDAIVFQKDNLEEVMDRSIVVYHLAD